MRTIRGLQMAYSKNHGENLMESEPYLASWFAYCLKGDKEAGMAFM